MIHVRFMHLRRIFLFIGLLIVCTKIYAASNVASNRCSQALPKSSATLKMMRTGGVAVEKIPVTAHDFATIIHNLNLNNELLQRMKEPGVQVLSLGEGASDLLPQLLRRGIDIKALDLWYHSDPLSQHASQINDPRVKEMLRYQNLYGQHLIAGSALDIPLPDESKNIVLAHLLANNFDAREQLRIITESVRILKPNGEARISLSATRIQLDSLSVTAFYIQTLLNVLETIYKSDVDFYFDTGLLIVKKLRSTQKVAWQDLPMFTHPLFFQISKSIDELHRLDLEKAKLAYNLAWKNLQRDKYNITLLSKYYEAEKRLKTIEFQL